MPCRKADHNHEWPSTGILTIFPCETICCLCESTKEYKPASALRKHVQTHIKNDKLPLSLLRSTGGRPKLSSRRLTLHRQVAVVQSPTAASSIAYTPMLGVEQSPTTSASELDAPLDVPGADSVKDMRVWTTSAEATHDYMKTTPDTNTLPYLSPSSDPLHSPQIEQLTESLARIRIESGVSNT